MSDSAVVEAAVAQGLIDAPEILDQLDSTELDAVDATPEAQVIQVEPVEVEKAEQPAPATDATPAPTDNGEGEQGEPVEQPEQSEPVQPQHQSIGLSLAEQVEAMERQVADESVELAELDAQRSELKKRLKVSVELLVDLRAKIEAKTSGARPGPTENATSSAAVINQASPEIHTAPSPAAQHIDPATVTPLEQLGITPGRLENLKSTEAAPGRNCTTIADLERLIREGRLQHVRGFGEKAIDAVTDALMAWRSKNPVPSADPGIAIPDDIASSCEDCNEYQAGARAATSGQKVSSNPHKQGSHAWGVWDRGWQDHNPGEDIG